MVPISRHFIRTTQHADPQRQSIANPELVKNTASSQQLNDMLKGSPANTTSNYSGSPVVSFDLVSTYVGYAVTTAASISLPQSCTIQLKSTKTDGTTVSALCSYLGTLANPQVEFCDFKGQLNGVTYVSGMPTDTKTLSATTVEYLDNPKAVEYFRS